MTAPNRSCSVLAPGTLYPSLVLLVIGVVVNWDIFRDGSWNSGTEGMSEWLRTFIVQEKSHRNKLNYSLDITYLEYCFKVDIHCTSIRCTVTMNRWRQQVFQLNTRKNLLNKNHIFLENPVVLIQKMPTFSVKAFFL